MRMKLFILVVLVCTCSVSQSADDSNTHNITVVYAANLPDIMDEKKAGLAELHSLINSIRNNKKSVLFIHGGNSLAPSTLSSFDLGVHMIDILNTMKPVAMAVAKHELIYQEDELTLRAYEAAFPMLSANIYDPSLDGNLDGLEKSRLVEIGGVTVGILAATSQDAMIESVPKRIQIFDVVKSTRIEAMFLRNCGANIIIALFDSNTPQLIQLLEDKVVDVIIAPNLGDENILTNTAGLMISPTSRGDFAVVLNLSVVKGMTSGSLNWQSNTSFNELKNYDPDPEIKELIKSYTIQVSQLLNKRVGLITTPLDTRKKLSRTQETGFGNLLTDALRSTMKSDIALINGGTIRGNRTYEAGIELRRRDIQVELAHRNYAVKVEITGEQIWTALEHGFSKIKSASGRFPHVSGMTIQYSPSAKTGSRVQTISIGGEPIDFKKTYTLATNDYLLKGGDGYLMLKGLSLIQVGRKTLVWQVVQNFLTNRKTVSPKIEGRIVIVSP
jgi:5'-nucleotidase/UDP-sugar diphosphatase